MATAKMFPMKGTRISKPAITGLLSKLNIRVLPKYRRFPDPNIQGPGGRLRKMQKTMTALVIHERLELNYHRGDEVRGYAERLISDVIRYGDCHKPTMDLAKFWIMDEAAVPKLFKVLAPRFKDWPIGLPYTRMVRAPANIKDYFNNDELHYGAKAVLELRGNPYPPLPGPFVKPHPGAIHNVLLEEARKEYFKSQSKMERYAEQGINAWAKHIISQEDTSDNTAIGFLILLKF